MSTKIYDTVYNSDIKNPINEIIEKAINNVEKIREEYVLKLINEIIKNFNFNILNQISPRDMEGETKPLDYKKLFMGNLSFYDNDFERTYLNAELSVVDYDLNRHNVNLEGKLIQFWGLNNFSLKNEIENLPYSRKFDYYNNTEMDVAENEERLREKVWKKIFKETSIPSKAGNVIVVYNFLKDFQDNHAAIFKIIEENLFMSLETFDISKFQKSIYMKAKINSVFEELKKKKLEKEPDCNVDSSISLFLSAEGKARDCYEQNLPLEEKEKKFADYISTEIQRRIENCLVPNNRKTILNFCKSALRDSVEKTISNKVEEQKRFDEYDRIMEENKEKKKNKYK